MSEGSELLGARHEERFVVTADLVDAFADLSGDRNPIHVDTAAARERGHPERVAHGALSLAVLSRIIGTRLPGPGALWLSNRVEWPAPVYVGDEVVIRAVVRRHSVAVGVIQLSIEASKQDGTIVMRGQADVKVPEGARAPVADGATAGKVALVTGGSRGVGARIARSLAARGHRVAVGYARSEAAADALAKELGAGARSFRADLTDPSGAPRLAATVLEEFGRIDVLVHCATPPLPKTPASELTRADLSPYWSAYVEAGIDLVRALSPGMKQRHFGRFIFLGTSAMFGPATPGWSSYLVAKHALYGLVRSLAVELGPSGITTNMVSPGMIATDLTADISARAKEVEAQRSPLRRLATADDVAGVVAFLIGDQAAYVNGANIPLTGGPV